MVGCSFSLAALALDEMLATDTVSLIQSGHIQWMQCSLALPQLLFLSATTGKGTRVHALSRLHLLLHFYDAVTCVRTSNIDHLQQQHALATGVGVVTHERMHAIYRSHD